jgi:hypothetical protein
LGKGEQRFLHDAGGNANIGFPSIPIWKSMAMSYGDDRAAWAVFVSDARFDASHVESLDSWPQTKAAYDNLTMFSIANSDLKYEDGGLVPLLTGDRERSRQKSARLQCERFRKTDYVVFPSFGRDPEGVTGPLMRQARACGADIAVPISNKRLREQQCQPVRDHLFLADILIEIMAIEPAATVRTKASTPHATSDPLRWSTRQCDRSPLNGEAYLGIGISSLCRYTAVSCCKIEGSFVLHSRLEQGVESVTLPFYATSKNTKHITFSFTEAPFLEAECTSQFRKAVVFGAYDDNNLAHFIHDTFSALWWTVLLDAGRARGLTDTTTIIDRAEELFPAPQSDVLLIHAFRPYRLLPFLALMASVISTHPVVHLDEVKTASGLCFDELIAGTDGLMHVSRDPHNTQVLTVDPRHKLWPQLSLSLQESLISADMRRSQPHETVVQSRATTATKMLLNEAAIVEWLRSWNIEPLRVVDFEKLTNRAAWELMARTRVMVGVFSSGLSNGHFMRRGSVLVVIYPYNFGYPCSFAPNSQSGEHGLDFMIQALLYSGYNHIGWMDVSGDHSMLVGEPISCFSHVAVPQMALWLAIEAATATVGSTSRDTRVQWIGS